MFCGSTSQPQASSDAETTLNVFNGIGDRLLSGFPDHEVVQPILRVHWRRAVKLPWESVIAYVPARLQGGSQKTTSARFQFSRWHIFCKSRSQYKDWAALSKKRPPLYKKRPPLYKKRPPLSRKCHRCLAKGHRCMGPFRTPAPLFGRPHWREPRQPDIFKTVKLAPGKS